MQQHNHHVTGRPTGGGKNQKSKYALQFDLGMSCIGEKSSPFGGGTQSTNNNNKNRCGCGVVLSVRTGVDDILNDCICHAHVISREDRHMNMTSFIQELKRCAG